MKHTKEDWKIEIHHRWVDQYGTGDSVNIQTYGICAAIPDSDTRNYTPSARATGVKIANDIASLPNAKVIAAAPDLLDTLKALHSAAWDKGCSALLSIELSNAMKAIQKATE